MTLKLPDLHFTPEPVELGMASVDLTLAAVPGPDRLYLEWQYMTELFDAGHGGTAAEQFRGVLARLVAAPDSTVAEVELTEAVGGQVGPPSAAMSRDPGFLELFRQRVGDGSARPGRRLRSGGHDVRRTGAGRGPARPSAAQARRRAGTPVGVLVDRSPRLAVAILGVLAAGGVYVPLGPVVPGGPHWLHPLSTPGPKVLVADGGSARRLREAGAVLPEHVIVADADEPATDQAYPALPVAPP
jgi:non-ribosomal peptide synthetase component F